VTRNFYFQNNFGMKPSDQTNDIQKETLEIVLNELIEEQKNANKINSDLVSAINQLTGKVIGVNEKLDKKENNELQPDVNILQDILNKGITQMLFIKSAQPKSVVRKFQILLFPEQDAKLFYKVVFGRWFMWLALMLFFTFFYKWMMYRTDRENQLKMVELKQNKLVNAWNYLYSQKDRKLHMKMDSALSTIILPDDISK
jgi:hypothetical protein